MSDKGKSRKNYGASLGRRVLEQVGDDLNLEPSEPRPQLARRGIALTNFSGDMVYTQNQWVDPALCRPSDLNSRDYAALSFDDCAELIDTIKSEGQQRTPAIVRPTGDAAVPYEIVAGNRRHWSISWLRANNYPDFKYLINIQQLDDEAAFRWSDLENRARTDISDFERARGYATALHRLYNNSKVHMAERIGISRRNLSRFLDLGELNPIFIEALGGFRVVQVNHGQQIKQIFPTPAAMEMGVALASEIAVQQKELADKGDKLLPAHQVIKTLQALAANEKIKTPKAAPLSLVSQNGIVMVEYQIGSKTSPAKISVIPGSGASRSEIMDAVMQAAERILDEKFNQ